MYNWNKDRWAPIRLFRKKAEAIIKLGIWEPSFQRISQIILAGPKKPCNITFFCHITLFLLRVRMLTTRLCVNKQFFKKSKNLKDYKCRLLTEFDETTANVVCGCSKFAQTNNNCRHKFAAVLQWKLCYNKGYQLKSTEKAVICGTNIARYFEEQTDWNLKHSKI